MDTSSRRRKLDEISPNKIDSASKRVRQYISPKKCSIELCSEKENFDYLLNDSDEFLLEERSLIQGLCGDSGRGGKFVEISPNKIDSAGKRARQYISPKKCSTELSFEKENFDYLLNDFDGFMREEHSLSEGFSDDFLEDAKQTKFSLESWQRCLVDCVDRDPRNFDLILQLVNETNSDEKAQCRLQGMWVHTKLDVGDLVSILAIWNEPLDCFVVSNVDGMIVTNPDHLISGTSVVGSLFCQRRGVLQEKFRGIDSDSKAMIIGSVTHELFQTVLTRKLRTTEQIERACDEFLLSENVMYMMFQNRTNVEDMKNELAPFITHMVDFVEKYLPGRGCSKEKTQSDYPGVIDSIQDIEENVWVPRLGLKGKIDVSVRVRPRSYSSRDEKKCLPLELKTGRATFSNEHKGQLMIYEMMLQEIGRNVDSGLLLYLREGIMKEIPSTKNSKRDIIILRNELSYYLTRKIKLNNLDDLSTVVENYRSVILPDPISHHNACSKCPYNTICSLYLKQDKTSEISETMQKISAESMDHLGEDDVNYFTHWCGILTLEDQEAKKGNRLKSLWTKTPEERSSDGQALINLKIIGDVLASESKFLHNFDKDKSLEPGLAYQDFTLTGITPGDYVIVSTCKRIAIATGHVYEIKRAQISVHLERNLNQNYNNERFIIDKNIYQSTNVFSFTNLGVLLEDRDESNKLRKIVVNKMQPTFKTEQISLPKSAHDILKDLNADQRRAVAKALKMNDYMLLKGLPGTGKTQTLVAIIRLFCLMHKSIIITSHTHSAVDNVLGRLKRHGVKFLRLGSDSRIDASLRDCGETHLTQKCKTPNDLSRVYSTYNVVGVTCFGAAHSLFLHRRFDVCIVDEATQVFQPTVLRPLFYANTFILVGDPDQLPPVVKSKIAQRIGASESLFQRLDDSTTTATAVLSTQYRMNKAVTKLANSLTYGGNLKCANEAVSNRIIELPRKADLFARYRTDKWLLRSLERHVDLSVVVLDTKDCLQRSQEFERSQSVDLAQIIEKTFADEAGESVKAKFTYTNYCDAAVAFYLVKSLIIGGCAASDIGIIAPYRAQVELLRKIYMDYSNYYSSSEIASTEQIDFRGLEVNTVDQYQGRDKDVIIYSCTRTGKSAAEKTAKGHVAEILDDQRRLTVAITRSKCKLIIIGDQECLRGYGPFKELLENIPSRCKIGLEDGSLGFSWSHLFRDMGKVLSL